MMAHAVLTHAMLAHLTSSCCLWQHATVKSIQAMLSYQLSLMTAGKIASLYAYNGCSVLRDILQCSLMLQCTAALSVV